MSLPGRVLSPDPNRSLLGQAIATYKADGGPVSDRAGSFSSFTTPFANLSQVAFSETNQSESKPDIRFFRPSRVESEHDGMKVSGQNPQILYESMPEIHVNHKGGAQRYPHDVSGGFASPISPLVGEGSSTPNLHNAHISDSYGTEHSMGGVQSTVTNPPNSADMASGYGSVQPQYAGGMRSAFATVPDPAEMASTFVASAQQSGGMASAFGSPPGDTGMQSAFTNALPPSGGMVSAFASAPSNPGMQSAFANAPPPSGGMVSAFANTPSTSGMQSAFANAPPPSGGMVSAFGNAPTSSGMHSAFADPSPPTGGMVSAFANAPTSSGMHSAFADVPPPAGAMVSAFGNAPSDSGMHSAFSDAPVNTGGMVSAFAEQTNSGLPSAFGQQAQRPFDSRKVPGSVESTYPGESRTADRSNSTKSRGVTAVPSTMDYRPSDISSNNYNNAESKFGLINSSDMEGGSQDLGLRSQNSFSGVQPTQEPGRKQEVRKLGDAHFHKGISKYSLEYLKRSMHIFGQEVLHSGVCFPFLFRT